MVAPAPNNSWDRLYRALRQTDPSNPVGPWQLITTGTVHIGGGAVGGAGGTSMTDDASFIPGGTSITPMGGYFGGRQVGSGHAAAPAISGSGILQVHVVAGGAGGGVANLTMQGTAGNDVSVGVASGAAGAAGNWALPVQYASGMYATVNVGNVVNTVGSVRAIALGGSVGVTQITSPWVVVGSAGVTQITNPWVVVGSVRITAATDFTVWLANAGAGGGFASVAVYGSPAMPVYNIGTVHVSNFAAGNGFASVAVYGSPAMPVYIVGSEHITNGSLPAINLGGSVGVTQITTPWVMVGSAQVTPVAAFSLAGVPQVNPLGSLAPTQWIISGAASGQFVVAGSAPAGLRVRLSSFHLVAEGTIDMRWMSPSGVSVSGSMRILPGAGFAMAGAIPNSPVLMGSQQSAIYIHSAGTQNIGGVAMGWVE